MSRVSMTLCDGCGADLTDPKPLQPDLCLIVTLAKVKITTHYCYKCATPLVDMMNKMAEKRFEQTRGGNG